MQMNFDEFRGSSWLYKEISQRTKFPRTFEAHIVLVCQNYKQYFTVDASKLQSQEGKFALLDSLVQNFMRIIKGKCSPCIVVVHSRKI